MLLELHILSAFRAWRPWRASIEIDARINASSLFCVSMNQRMAQRKAGVPHELPSPPTPRYVTRWLNRLFCVMLPVATFGDVQTTTQTLAANISPYGALSVPGNVDLRSPNTKFGTMSGSLTVSYWARTSSSGGGSVTVQAGSDFSPSGGPSVSSVTYSCSGATLGTGCSGNQTLATSTQAPLVSLPGNACTGGGAACSTQDPNTVLLTFSAPNKPRYKTGTFSAQITLTISTM